ILFRFYLFRQHPTSTPFPYPTLFRSGVIDGVSQVHTRRSDVSHRESHAPRELALDIQVPLHPVGTTGIEFNVRGLDRARSEQTRSEEHTSELQSPYDLVCRLLLEKKK